MGLFIELVQKIYIKEDGLPKESGYYDTDLGRLLYTPDVLWTNTFGYKPEYYFIPSDKIKKLGEGFVKGVLSQYVKEEISFGKMVELFNQEITK